MAVPCCKWLPLHVIVLHCLAQGSTPPAACLVLVNISRYLLPKLISGDMPDTFQFILCLFVLPDPSCLLQPEAVVLPWWCC